MLASVTLPGLQAVECLAVAENLRMHTLLVSVQEDVAVSDRRSPAVRALDTCVQARGHLVVEAAAVVVLAVAMLELAIGVDRLVQI